MLVASFCLMVPLRSVRCGGYKKPWPVLIRGVLFTDPSLKFAKSSRQFVCHDNVIAVLALVHSTQL